MDFYEYWKREGRLDGCSFGLFQEGIGKGKGRVAKVVMGGHQESETKKIFKIKSLGCQELVTSYRYIDCLIYYCSEQVIETPLGR